ncbi:MAG: hypothetical protein H6576_15455 [Lewinellaceae bacterium]|nr:hypothetical protein [Saprospiraceae bacterium]MCB9345091.1 hypothetical protein [Lewinellaceae bacterium]
MKNFVLFAALLLCLSNCKNDSKLDGAQAGKPASHVVKNDDPDFPASEGYIYIKGLMRKTGNAFGLLQAPNRNMYEILDSTHTLEARFLEAVGPLNYDAEAVYVEVTGKPGEATARTGQKFILSKIDKIETKNIQNLSSLEFPFDFWCYGPDWELQITSFEGGVYYINKGEQIAWRGNWKRPTFDGNTYSFDIPEIEGIGGAMKIVIKKEDVVDPVTGVKYSNSVEITANGNTHKGWAVRGFGQFPVLEK